MGYTRYVPTRPSVRPPLAWPPRIPRPSNPSNLPASPFPTRSGDLISSFSAVHQDVVLRGAIANLLNDLERAVNDGMNVINALTQDE